MHLHVRTCALLPSSVVILLPSLFPTCCWRSHAAPPPGSRDIGPASEAVWSFSLFFDRSGLLPSLHYKRMAGGRVTFARADAEPVDARRRGPVRATSPECTRVVSKCRVRATDCLAWRSATKVADRQRNRQRNRQTDGAYFS